MEHEKTKFAQIEYRVSTGDNREIYLQYPSSSLLACGKGLIVRTDCPKTTE